MIVDSSVANELVSGGPERLDPWEFPAFEPFEKGAAGGRDITELVHDPGHGERRYGVAAAGDAHQCAGTGQFGGLFRQRDRGALEGRRLEGADRPVPDQGAARLETRRDA